MNAASFRLERGREMGDKRLPIYLLSTIASHKDDSTNCQIASYILENLESVKGMTIVELAKHCYVSNSSISRFCKDIGLHDFVELKDLLQSTELSYCLLSQKESVKERSQEFADMIQEGIKRVAESIDYRVIDLLAKDLMKYPRIAAFGLLKAESAAMNFQHDMLMLGKIVTTKVSFSQQKEYMKKADENDCILIFSYGGYYFNHYDRLTFKEGHKPKIYMITANKNSVNHEFVDEIIYFASPSYMVAIPYLIHFIEGMIAQNLAYIIRQKEAIKLEEK